MNLGLSDSLRTLVRQKFAQARHSQELIFSDTQLAVLNNRSGISFQLRYCPALAKKPSKDNAEGSNQKSTKAKFDPFENPSDALLIAQIPSNDPSHILVLNKYPVIPNHFILATKANKLQENLLQPDDLGLSYACLKAWQEGKIDSTSPSLYAFFNSGTHSGASQPHRHLQFLPVEDMTGSSPGDWKVLCDRMTIPIKHSPSLMHDSELPFRHFAASLEPSVSWSNLHGKYILLMKAAHAAIKDFDASLVSDAENIVKDGRTTFSYNLAMTTTAIAILPRRREGSVIAGLPDSDIALNGTILAGTLMVKLESEWKHLRENPELVDDVFINVGVPAVHENRTDSQRL